MQRKPCKRSKIPKWQDDDSPKFCKAVTMDTAICESEISRGVTGDTDAHILGCRSTKYFDGFPAKGKSHVECMKAINDFKGTAKIETL